MARDRVARGAVSRSAVRGFSHGEEEGRVFLARRSSASSRVMRPDLCPSQRRKVSSKRLQGSRAVAASPVTPLRRPSDASAARSAENYGMIFSFFCHDNPPLKRQQCVFSVQITLIHTPVTHPLSKAECFASKCSILEQSQRKPPAQPFPAMTTDHHEGLHGQQQLSKARYANDVLLCAVRTLDGVASVRVPQMGAR